ncbi:ThiF family adenylyltransferase [Mycobacterium gordonae]|uniref:ThiF family adenylyltransferase n=1 Tax=Mycobacterium gordonae TaxID=1778 RepID=UPI0007C83D0F|nr:ThiF family adenylyltransferase [Mycobacterium gordonae]
MSTLKFTHGPHWDRIQDHLTSGNGERFAFAFTRPLQESINGPVLEVLDVALIPDHDVEFDGSGWCLSASALDRVHNQALRSHTGLAEFHNHRFGPPRFSVTDEDALTPMASYVVDLLPGRPYVAGVWAQNQLHAEWWRRNGDGGLTRGTLDAVTATGDQMRVLNAAPVAEDRISRQIPLLGHAGQGTVAGLRVAVVGGGGTGSQVLLNMAYLGFRSILVLDDDTVEPTNLNRLVTADADDVGLAKTEVARQRLHAIDPRIAVTALPGLTVDGEHPELSEVDLIIGCLDHDGPRHRLNQIAIDTATPYLDIATGVDDRSTPPAVGGRVIFLRPGGPCLMCLGELDTAEVSRWAKPPVQQRLDREHGYGSGAPAPSVVHLNALTASAAITELVAWISGSRAPADWLDIDLQGAASRPGTQIGPRRIPPADANCVACSRRT